MIASLDVVIERDVAGRLHAHVRQKAEDGFTKRGADILKERHVRDVDSAIRECDLHFHRLFQSTGAKPSINYVLPGQTQ